MDSFTFRARVGKLNWRLVSSLDLNDIIDSTNTYNNKTNSSDSINDLQLALDIVTFCEFNNDDVRNNAIDNITKLVKLMQLMIGIIIIIVITINNTIIAITIISFVIIITTLPSSLPSSLRSSSLSSLPSLSSSSSSLLEYLLYCQEKQCEVINVMNKKYKDTKERKHKLAKENAGLIEDSRIYKKQLDLLRASLAKSHRLIVQREFRNAPPRVALDRMLSSETKEGIEIARDWLTDNDDDYNQGYSHLQSSAPTVIVDTILQHEKETRDFMQQMLEEQRSFFYDEMKSVNKNQDRSNPSVNDTESIEKLRQMFEHITSDLLSNIQTNQSTVLEKLITEFSARQESVIDNTVTSQARPLSLENNINQPNVDYKADDKLNQSNHDIDNVNLKSLSNDNSLQVKIAFLEQRINDYEQREEQWKALEQQYQDDINSFTSNARKDSTTIIDLKRKIIKHENEKQYGAAQLLLCSIQKAVFKRYSKYFSKWHHFSVKSHQLETEDNYQNIIDRITIEYDSQQQHLTEENYRKQKELEDRVDSESKKNIINEARINHTKLQIQKAKEEELEKLSRRAEAAIMTSIDFSTITKTISTATECQTIDTIDTIDKVSVTTSMSELPPNLLKGIKEKEESLKKIDEKYLQAKHEDDLMKITQNKIDTTTITHNKEDVHTSLAAEIAKRLKTFHF